MKINDKGLLLIKYFEGLRLSVYLDAVGLPTVGYGHMDKSMKVGDKITQQKADELLLEDLSWFESGVDSMLKNEISSNQFSALVCFAYNIGLGNLKSSTLLKCVNSGQFDKAADEFLKWNKAGGKVLSGLTKRRQAERDLFLS